MSESTHESRELLDFTLLDFTYQMVIASSGDIGEALRVLQGYVMSYASGTFPMTARELSLVSQSIKRFEALLKAQ